MARKPARARRLSVEQTDEQADLDLEAVLATPHGRRVIWQIIIESGVFAALGAQHLEVAAWLEGRRDVGVFIMAWADRIDTSLVPLMMQEKANAVLESAIAPSPSPTSESSDG